MIWTPDRQERARAALWKWLGTPYGDRIAIVSVGIDCVKFVYEVLCEAGIVDRRQFGGYDVAEGAHAPTDKLQRAFQHCFYCEPVAAGAPLAFGDIAILKTGTRSKHCAFFDGENLWHSLAGRWVTKSQFSLWQREIDVMLRLSAVGHKNDPATAVKL